MKFKLIGMRIISVILKLFAKPRKFEIIKELNRNDKCYCNSGLKFKNCHYRSLLKNKKEAYWIRDYKTKEQKIKILKLKNTKSIRIKSNLYWEQIGVGGTGKIDP